MRSMTGFAERSFVGAGLHVKISLKSLNHRFFDWNYKGSPLGEVENKLRAIAQQKLRRGRVEASVEMIFLEPSGWHVVINEGLLEKILSSLHKISGRLGRAPFFSLDTLFSIPQLIEIRRKEFSSAQIAFLERIFEQTTEEVLKQRRREGSQIARQLRRHLRSLRGAISRIERLNQRQPMLVRQKIEERLKGLNSKLPLAAGRLEEEVAFLAQRADIAEEIQRLKAHVDGFEKALEEESENPVGKRLDFLAQEIYREANTINSKSQDIDIIRESLTIKGEVESLRQQVQNLE